jgi:RNA polymerase sigma factor (sigma-70 family)
MDKVDDEGIESLVKRARAGDLDAFGQIVRRFQDMAHGYAFSYLGDFHRAEDVAQEAFIDVYLKLPKLREPTAFPGWFRRIVRTHCHRAARGKRIEAASLDTVLEVAAAVEQKVARDEEVLAAIRALPEHQRVATTLFYINGYSQKEIAAFLEAPVTTVQKRLHDSRKKLKERMLEMVEETLREHAAGERLSQAVIAELLARPKPLEIEGHPVREVADAIRKALPEYEYIEGEEIVRKSAVVFPSGEPGNAYSVDSEQVLRTETTVTVLQAMAGRTAPVRLLTAGRVFRPDQEDVSHANVFHQVDVLCIGSEITEETMKATVSRALEAALGPVEVRWEPHEFPRFERFYEACVKRRGRWLEIAGCGMLTARTLADGGFKPESVSGFAFGASLERLATLKHGIDDIRKLWQAPYIPRR